MSVERRRVRVGSTGDALARPSRASDDGPVCAMSTFVRAVFKYAVGQSAGRFRDREACLWFVLLLVLRYPPE